MNTRIFSILIGSVIVLFFLLIIFGKLGPFFGQFLILFTELGLTGL